MTLQVSCMSTRFIRMAPARCRRSPRPPRPTIWGGPARLRRPPMSWSAMDATGYVGLELWSLVTDSAEKIDRISDALRFIITPGRFVDHPPSSNLEIWDELCRARRCVALGGIDAHQIGIRIGNRVPLRLMAYKRSFRYLRTHLLTDRPLEKDLERD